MIFNCCNFALFSFVFYVGPSALSLEEQRLLQSLDRLNERLKGIRTIHFVPLCTSVCYKSFRFD